MSVEIPGYMAWHVGDRPDPLRGFLHRPAHDGEQGPRPLRQVRGHHHHRSRTRWPSTVTASVDLDSINTNQEQRDAHIRSADFLEVEKYPTMTFTSTGC